MQVGEVESCSYFYGFLFPPCLALLCSLLACPASLSLPHFRKSSNLPDPLYPAAALAILVWHCFVSETNQPKSDNPKSSSLSPRPAALPPYPSPLQLSLLTLLFRPNIPPPNRTQISRGSLEQPFHIWLSVSLRSHSILPVSRNPPASS